MRALSAWKKISKKTADGDPVFVDDDGTPFDPDEATDLYRPTIRAALVAANYDRPELWPPARGQMELRLHNARASFVIVALLNAGSEDLVRRRSKHKSSAIERYRRELGTFRELKLGDWKPLDRALPEIAALLVDSVDTKTSTNLSTEVSDHAEDEETGTYKTERVRGLRTQSGREDSNLRPLDPQRGIAEDAHGLSLPSTADPPSSEGPSERLLPRSAAASDPVESALAAALTAAATAGRFDVVALLAKELEARRIARAGNVIALPSRGDRTARR